MRNWRTLLGGRGLWLVLLIVCAACYYGSYVRHGINFRDEGGTEALVAQRLLAGERPLVDVVLGYNVLWFYPIVGLFKLFGVNFVLLRGYCFFLSTVTAVTGFCAVTRASRRPWLGFLTGLLLVLVPGMTFKNYMPLLAVTNGACLLQFALAEGRSRWRWLAAGGALLGLTYLIRIDVGLFVSLLWLGSLFFRAVERGGSPAASLRLVGGGVALLLGLVLALHLPVYLDAKHRGFNRPFLRQYGNWPASFAQQIQQRFSGRAPAASRPPAVLVASLGTLEGVSPKAAPVPSRDTLPRKGLGDLVRTVGFDAKLLIVLLYLPLVSLGLLTLWSLVQLLVAWQHRATAQYGGALGALVLLGASLTTFPQYFFFRPDAPHLSEFSPGFWMAVVGSLSLLSVPNGFRRKLTLALSVFLAFHAALFLLYMLRDRWTGTIDARKFRTHYFQAENGVNVYVTRRELEGLTGLLTAIRENSKPGDYLVAYPYHPAVNLLSNRPTYEKNVYVDNAISDSTWNGHAIERLKKFQPPVVVLSDWDINGTEASRFSAWAAPTKAYVLENYNLQGVYLELQVYTRKPAP